MKTRPLCAVLVSSLLLPGASIAYSQATREPFTYLKNHVGFSDQGFLAVAQRRIVTKVLKTVEQDEVAVMGVLRLNVPQAVFFDVLRNVDAYEYDSVSKIKPIQVPPQLGDFAAVALNRGEIDDLGLRRGRLPESLPLAPVVHWPEEMSPYESGEKR